MAQRFSTATMTDRPGKSDIEAAWFEFKSGASSSIKNKLVEIKSSSLEKKLRNIDEKLDTVAKNLYQVGMMLHQFIRFSKEDKEDKFQHQPDRILKYMYRYLDDEGNIDRLEKHEIMHEFEPMPRDASD